MPTQWPPSALLHLHTLVLHCRMLSCLHSLVLDFALWHTIYPWLPCKQLLTTTQAFELTHLSFYEVWPITHSSFETTYCPLASINGASIMLALSSAMLQVLSQQCSLPFGLTYHSSTNVQSFTTEGLHKVSQLDAPINTPSWNWSSRKSHTLVTCPITCSKVSSILALEYSHAYYLWTSFLELGLHLMLTVIIHVFALNNPLL